MKFLIVSLAVLAVVAADVAQPVAILKQAQDISPDGAYSYSFEAENGIAQQESGSLSAVSPDESPVVVAEGQYQYTAPDGTPIAVSYVADANGFQPQGEHIHPVPALIQRALDYIAAHPPKEEQ